MTTHEWREPNEDGEMIYYRVNHHAGRWTFFYRPRSEPDWISYETPPYPVLAAFREVLWNKIQRRRAPEKLITQIDAMISAAKPAAGEEEE